MTEAKRDIIDKPLNGKQKKVAELFVLGCELSAIGMGKEAETEYQNCISNKKNAYLAVYHPDGYNLIGSKSHCANNNLVSNAYRVFNRANVKKYVDELRVMQNENAKHQLAQMEHHLVKIFKQAERDDDRKAMLKVLEMYNKMTGAYVTKIESDNHNTNELVIKVENKEDNILEAI